MIWLFDSKTKFSSSYKTFEEVCDHFRRLQHLNHFSEEGPCEEERWDFAYWSHKRLSSLHEHLKDTHLSQAEREAYEGELDLIEIFDGGSEFADQYVVTPNLDVSSLMREWCFDYAYAHGYTVLETFPTKLPDSPPSAVSPTLEGMDWGGFQGTLKEGAQP